MKSIAMIQAMVTSLIPNHMLKHMMLTVYGWNRFKDGRSNGEFINIGEDVKDHNLIPKRWIRHGYHGSSCTNQAYGHMHTDELNWESTIRDLKVGKHLFADYEGWADTHEQIQAKLKEELGIGARIKDLAHGNDLFIPMIDFNPGLMMTNRHTKGFWQALSEKYADKRLYLFNSGNAHHGVLNTLMDQQQYMEWMTFLYEHAGVVDEKWVTFAMDFETEHFGVIRMTEGKTRPAPTLLKWVNL
jgi:hypothetical protein